MPVNRDLAKHRMTDMEWSVLSDVQVVLEVRALFEICGVNSINCFTTVNHRLAGPGIMVKLHLLFVGREVCLGSKVYLRTDFRTSVCNLMLLTTRLDGLIFLRTLMSHKNHTVDVKEYEEFPHKNVLRLG
jgi:hypothetical protein